MWVVALVISVGLALGALVAFAVYLLTPRKTVAGRPPRVTTATGRHLGSESVDPVRTRVCIYQTVDEPENGMKMDASGAEVRQNAATRTFLEMVERANATSGGLDCVNVILRPAVTWDESIMHVQSIRDQVLTVSAEGEPFPQAYHVAWAYRGHLTLKPGGGEYLLTEVEAPVAYDLFRADCELVNPAELVRLKAPLLTAAPSTSLFVRVSNQLAPQEDSMAFDFFRSWSDDTRLEFWLRHKRLTDHQTLAKLIRDTPNFLLNRLGTGEMTVCESVRVNPTLTSRHIGVSPPNEEQVDEFRRRYLASFRDSDAAVEWDASWFPGEKVFLDYFLPARCLRGLHGETTSDVDFYLQPETRSQSWFQELAGRRVLVVHFFAETMRRQYEKKVFEFPAFASVAFIKAPNTQAEPEDQLDTTWTEELEKVCAAVRAETFDVALIGCAAYSAPLAHFVKRECGRSAIVMGSGLQLFFGVKGRRWEAEAKYGYIRRHFDSQWVSAEERPANWRKIENGAYW